MFWTDNWLNGQSVKATTPLLCCAVGKRTQSSLTVAQALDNNRWIQDISGGLSVQAIA
jgi:hypothetical protein